MFHYTILLCSADYTLLYYITVHSTRYISLCHDTPRLTKIRAQRCAIYSLQITKARSIEFRATMRHLRKWFSSISPTEIRTTTGGNAFVSISHNKTQRRSTMHNFPSDCREDQRACHKEADTFGNTRNEGAPRGALARALYFRSNRTTESWPTSRVLPFRERASIIYVTTITTRVIARSRLEKKKGNAAG